jgi:hypothetical protein
MSAWDDSHWTGYTARINNVFAADTVWLDFTYVSLGHVGWRRVRQDADEWKTRILAIATEVMTSGKLVLLRVTNAGEITAIQTI